MLTIGNAYRIFVRAARFSGIRPIDDDAKYRADRVAAQLDVEYLEPVAPRDVLRGLADTVQLFSRWRKNVP